MIDFFEQIIATAKSNGRLERLTPIDAPWLSGSPMKFVLQQVSMSMRQHAYSKACELVKVMVAQPGGAAKAVRRKQWQKKAATKPADSCDGAREEVSSAGQPDQEDRTSSRAATVGPSSTH